MNIRPASIADLGAIRAIALRTWPVAYGDILSPAQLSYMLDLMYTEEALMAQLMEKGHHFNLLVVGGDAKGFSSHEHHHAERSHTRLHKLYTLPQAQGLGFGKELLLEVLRAVRAAGDHMVELNVNRFNKARGFYEKCGFRVVRDEVIDIGHGYVMDDHVMELSIG